MYLSIFLVAYSNDENICPPLLLIIIIVKFDLIDFKTWNPFKS